MKLKKILTMIITAAMAALSTIMSVNAMVGVPIIDEDGTPLKAYVSKIGVIKEVRDYFDSDGEVVEGRKFILAEYGGMEFTFAINEDTYIFEGTVNDLKEGANIMGLYDSARPMLMIYPPQLNIEYLAVGYDDITQIMVDRFNENFVDSKNYIKLNLTDKNLSDGVTEIIYEDGKEFEGKVADLVNRKMLVYYSVTTRSIPAITTPEKIIIFYEKIVPPVYILTDEDRKMLNQDYDNAVIRINGENINNKAYVSDKGYVMVPLREIAEAMGLSVEWFSDTKTVQVGKSLSFTLDKNQYAYNRKSPISLGEAPVLQNGLTYVPIDFFITSELGAVSSGYSYEFDKELESGVIHFILREDNK